MTRVVTRVLLALVAVVLGVFGGSAAAQQVGQGVEVAVPGPARPTPEFGFEPTQPLEQQGAREEEVYPGQGVKTRHEPAFVKPLVSTAPVSRTSGVRFGVSGWTAPGVPYDISNGGAAFGLTFMWTVPIAEPKLPREEPANQR